MKKRMQSGNFRRRGEYMLVSLGIFLVSSVIFFLIVSLYFSANPPATSATPATTLFFNPASSSIGVDQQFTTDARIDPGTNAVSAVEIHITYDQTKFRLDSITPSAAFSLELMAASINNTNGTASIALGIPLGTPSVTAITTIATFSFHSLAVVSNSSIAFTAASMAAADGETGDAIVTRTPETVTVIGAPTITNITSSHANGSFTVGEVIPVNVTFSTNVTSTGSVTVTLETGTTDRTCTFTVTNALTASCNYTVQAGDTSADLTVNIVAGTIVDQLSVPMTNFTPATNLGANKAIVIDTTAPANQDIVFTPSVSKTGGASVTIVSSGDATNNVWFAPSGTTTFTAGATMTKAASGTATTILAPATAGAYKLFIIDAVGNISAPSVATLTVDTTAPTATITYSDADKLVKSGDSLVITATFSEPLADAPIVKLALSGSNVLAAANMTKVDTTHYTYTRTVGAGNGTATVALSIGTDVAGNVITSAPTSGATFTVDNTAPTLTSITPIASVTRGTAPSFTFSSTEAGTITYSGGCSSSTTSAISGNNTITLNTLAVAAYPSCSLTVTDAATNASSSFSLGSFAVTYASDLNLDRAVNVLDFGILKTNYGTTNSAGDINLDGVVNILDFGILHTQYGSSV